MKKLLVLLMFVVGASLIISGCDGFDSSVSAGMSGGDYNGGAGATPGGAQDMSVIRQLIDNGIVPDPENFHVEGMFSEYDLPIEGPVPENIFTIRTSHGYAADKNLPGGGLYVQLGLSSSINAATFRRDPLNLSVVVDKSGSMHGSKIVGVKTALGKLVDQLDENDILSIVLFNHEMTVLLEPTPLGDVNVHEYIARIEAGGSTNMDIGMRKGYEFVRQYQEFGERSDRVILFTDALPNTGDDSPGNFRDITTEGANDGIGLTAFGIGADFDQNLINYIATQRGCNYFYLQDGEKTSKVFDEDFDFLVTPIAYDLNFEVELQADFAAVTNYGFPGGDSSTPGFEVSSIFLSRNRGALLLRFLPVAGADPLVNYGARIADIHLSYEDRDGLTHSEDLSVVYTGEDVDNSETHYFEQDGVRLTVSLAREVLSMKEACAYYHDPDDGSAEETLETLLIYLNEENEALGDDVLSREITMVTKLKNLVSERRPKA
ncbi:MAG: VWA domain-containing protein [Calditrichaeota bacterium]|nr:VWA domain-containing protein [Calditrichota bacterium]